MPGHNTRASLLVSGTQRSIFWIWVLSVLLIVYGSLSPDMHMDTQMQDSDKVLHFAAYTWLALAARMSCVPASKSAGLAVYLLAMGCVLELIQSVIPGRFFSLFDIGANAVGVGLGLVLATLIAHKGPRFLAPLIKE